MSDEAPAGNGVKVQTPLGSLSASGPMVIMIILFLALLAVDIYANRERSREALEVRSLLSACVGLKHGTSETSH